MTPPTLARRRRAVPAAPASMTVERATGFLRIECVPCDSDDLPATSECAGLNAAVLRGIQSTALTSRVTLRSGSPSEGWYCINSSNALQYMSAYNSKPADCSGAGMASLQPGDYIVLSIWREPDLSDTVQVGTAAHLRVHVHVGADMSCAQGRREHRLAG